MTTKDRLGSSEIKDGEIGISMYPPSGEPSAASPTLNIMEPGVARLMDARFSEPRGTFRSSTHLVMKGWLQG